MAAVEVLVVVGIHVGTGGKAGKVYTFKYP
jgi:hypothetical protein